MILLFFKHLINFTLVSKVFFTLKSPSEFNFKKYFGYLVLKEFIFTTTSLVMLATYLHGTDFLPPYFIYDGVLGIIMLLHIIKEKYLWKYKLILYEKDYFKWQALSKLKSTA